MERLWAIQPVTDKQRKSTRPEVSKALKGALARGGKPDEIESAFRVYYALPGCTKDEGRFARGAVVLLNDDKWRDFVPAGPASASGVLPAQWSGPPDIRERIVKATSEGFAVSWTDRCRWRDLPTPALVAPTKFFVDKIEQKAPGLLRDLGVEIVLEAAA